MLHLNFINAWLLQSVGLYRSVEKGLSLPYRHAVRYATKKDKDAFLRNAVSGVCMTVSTERCIPMGYGFA
jgi:hypothetical protein